MSRRTARNQPLPPEEAAFLNSLSGDALYLRVKDLYDAGWTLQAIGDVLTPERPRSTVRSWVTRPSDPLKRVDAPIPTPTYRTPAGGYQKKRPNPTEISPKELAEIQYLAPLARQYRAKMTKTSIYATSNKKLTQLCIRLHQDGVGITALAQAAGVTYRAMYKRVKL